MGFKSSHSVGLPPLMLLGVLHLMLGMCSADVAAAPILKVANNLTDGASLTVLHPPGCCSAFPECHEPLLCRAMCWECEDLVVEKGGPVGVLQGHSGAYPLPYLMIQVKETVYCAEEKALELIKPWHTLTVGPGACGPYTRVNRGLEAFVSVGKAVQETPLCLYVCNRG